MTFRRYYSLVYISHALLVRYGEAGQLLRVEVGLMHIDTAYASITIGGIVVPTLRCAYAGRIHRFMPVLAVCFAKSVCHLHRRHQMEKLPDRRYLVSLTDRISSSERRSYKS